MKLCRTWGQGLITVTNPKASTLKEDEITPLKLTFQLPPWLSKDTFSLSYSINLRLPHSCLSPLCTLTPSRDSRHHQTVFVAGLSLLRTGVNWTVTALPARRAVWCSVCIESRLEFFFPTVCPHSVFDENQTDFAEVWVSTGTGRLSAHRCSHAWAQPGTTEITCYQAEMSQAHRSFVGFKGTPGQSFPPLVIKLTQMKQ